MEEGTYEIGVDAQPGRYKTTVPQNSTGCYWERTKDDSGDMDSIIANDNVNPGAVRRSLSRAANSSSQMTAAPGQESKQLERPCLRAPCALALSG